VSLKYVLLCSNLVKISCKYLQTFSVLVFSLPNVLKMHKKKFSFFKNINHFLIKKNLVPKPVSHQYLNIFRCQTKKFFSQTSSFQSKCSSKKAVNFMFKVQLPELTTTIRVKNFCICRKSLKANVSCKSEIFSVKFFWFC
jgi:hypothetical protein